MKKSGIISIILLVFLVLSSVYYPFFNFSSGSIQINQDYVEGEHVRFYLADLNTGSVPDVTINSTWANVIPVIDGLFNPSEWNDAFKTNLYGFNQSCILYVKNDNDKLYLATTVPNNHGDMTDALIMSFSTTGSQDDPSPSVGLFNNGTSYLPMPRPINWVLLNGTVWNTYSTSEGRSWEVSVPLAQINVTNQNLQTNFKFYLSNGDYYVTNPRIFYWPAFSNGAQIVDGGSLGLASSSSENGIGITFLTEVSDMVSIMDKGYENLTSLFNYSPFSGQKISIQMDTSLFGTGVAMHSGNPIVASTVPSIQGFYHELTHDCNPIYVSGVFGEAVPMTIQTRLDSELTYSSQKDMLIFCATPETENYSEWVYNTYYLKPYETSGAHFETINLNSLDNVPIVIGMLQYLINIYGWNTLSRLSLYRSSNQISLDAWYPDTNFTIHELNLWVYALSLGAGRDLTDIFGDRWHFPLLGNSSFPCAISNGNSNYWININATRPFDIDSLNFDSSKKQLSFQTIQGLSNGYCNLTIPMTLLKQNSTTSWSVKINGENVNYVSKENETHSSLFFDFIDAMTDTVVVTGAETAQPSPTPTSTPKPSPLPTLATTSSPSSTTTPFPTPTPTPSPILISPVVTPTPSVPEFPFLAVLLLILGVTVSIVSFRIKLRKPK